MILEEVSSYLSTNGHPSAGLGSLPNTPDDAFALYEYGGSAPMLVKRVQAPVLEYPRFQVITRSKSYATARIKAERIYRLLAGYSGLMGGVGYSRVKALQSPFFLDRDDAGRARFVCNYEATKELSPLV
jgi:hypothetical protein